MTNVSALGLQILMTTALQNEQANLGTLSEQLASGKLHSNLTDYTPTQAANLLNFQNAVTQKNSYLNSITNVQTRLTIYDSTMTDMEKIATQASSLASQNQNYNATTVAQIAAQAQVYLQQTADDLNQKVGDRYIYSGTRYSQQPVTTDLNVLQGAPQTIINDNLTLPDYDMQEIGGTATNANAYTSDSVLIDTGFSVNYGVSSNNPSFQQLVNGLRYLYQATQSGNTPAFQTNMQQAISLLGSALTGIEAIHTNVADNQNILTTKTTSQKSDITTLQDQISNIQQVDLTEVGTKINTLQTQLQASYSATATLEQLSLVKYL